MGTGGAAVPITLLIHTWSTWERWGGSCRSRWHSEETAAATKQEWPGKRPQQPHPSFPLDGGCEPACKGLAFGWFQPRSGPMLASPE